MVESVAHFGTGLGLAAGAGLNAYAVLLVYGGIARLFPEDFPGAIARFLAEPTTLAVLLGLLVGVGLLLALRGHRGAGEIVVHIRRNDRIGRLAFDTQLEAGRLDLDRAEALVGHPVDQLEDFLEVQ